MPFVQLSNVVDIDIYRDLEAEISPEITAFFQSGVVAGGEYFDNLANSDGNLKEIIFWRDLNANVEPNYSSDQDVDSTPQNTEQAVQHAYKAHMNQSWGAYDLTRKIQTGQDAMRVIRNLTDLYWTRQWQRRIIAMMIGVYNANVAGNFIAGAAIPGVAGDMVTRVARDTAGTVGPEHLFSRTAMTQAAFTMGDHVDELVAIAVHSVIYQNMVDADDIDFIRDSKGTFSIPTYMGKVVIVDDSMPVIANGTTGENDYISILFGTEVVGYGMGDDLVPVEIDREPTKGHGGGRETLIEREIMLLHCLGHTNLNATASGNSGFQTLADLQLAANWARTHSRKNVPLAFLVTNG